MFISQQFLIVGDKKSPNNNADRNCRTAGWGRDHGQAAALHSSKKSAGALETQAHTAVDAMHGVIFAGEFTGVIGEDRHI
jgi:hypothetical protein